MIKSEPMLKAIEHFKTHIGETVNGYFDLYNYKLQYASYQANDGSGVNYRIYTDRIEKRKINPLEMEPKNINKLIEVIPVKSITLNHESIVLTQSNDIYLEDTDGNPYIIFYMENKTKLYNYNNYSELIKVLTASEVETIEKKLGDILPF
jgi:hypothetical protein